MPLVTLVLLLFGLGNFWSGAGAGICGPTLRLIPCKPLRSRIFSATEVALEPPEYIILGLII
eukprot:5685584-Amphidinium_carterae.1